MPRVMPSLVVQTIESLFPHTTNGTVGLDEGSKAP